MVTYEVSSFRRVGDEFKADVFSAAAATDIAYRPGPTAIANAPSASVLALVSGDMARWPSRVRAKMLTTMLPGGSPSSSSTLPAITPTGVSLRTMPVIAWPSAIVNTVPRGFEYITVRYPECPAGHRVDDCPGPSNDRHRSQADSCRR